MKAVRLTRVGHLDSDSHLVELVAASRAFHASVDACIALAYRHKLQVQLADVIVTFRVHSFAAHRHIMYTKVNCLCNTLEQRTTCCALFACFFKHRSRVLFFSLRSVCALARTHARTFPVALPEQRSYKLTFLPALFVLHCFSLE